MNLDQLKAKRTSIEAMEGLDESVKKAALGFLDRAIQSKTAADQIEQDTKALLDKVKSAPDRIKKLQEEMKRPLSSPDPSQLSAGMDLARAEQKAHQEDLNLVLAKAALGKWEAELEEERNLPAADSGWRQPRPISNCWKSAKNSRKPRHRESIPWSRMLDERSCWLKSADVTPC